MKKKHLTALEGALYCLLFAAAAIYIEKKILPQSLYYWNPVLFLKTFGFFHEIAILPGGSTTYVDKFLFQLTALPWLGTLGIVTISFLTGVFSFRVIAATTRVRLGFFLVIPLFFILIGLNHYRIIPLTKLLAALVFADAFIRLPGKNVFFRVSVFFIASCLFILIVRDLYWFFAALCMSFEILRRDDRWGGALYAVLAFVIVSVDYHYFSYLLHTKVGSPLSAITDTVQGGSAVEMAIVIGVALLAVSVAYRKKSISGIMLLPVIIIGYVDLRNWLPSSNAFFFLFIGTPLVIDLLSSRRFWKSIRWPIWTGIASTTLLSLSGVIVTSLTFNDYWSSVLRLNFYSSTRQWSAVLQEVQKPSLSDALPIMVSPFILEALHYTGKLPDDLFKYRQLYPPYAANVTPEMLREDLEQGKYMVNLRQNARVCFNLGLINYAELTAYDVLEYRADLLSSYQLIALVYLLKGNYEASRPFLSTIQQNLLSSAWADRYLAYADDPKRMEGDEYLMSIKSRILLTDDPIDSLMGRPPFSEIARRLVVHNADNRMASDYLMASYLINGQITRIYETFFPGDSSAAPLAGAIPRVCEEAVLMYLEATGQGVSPAVARRIRKSTLRDFMEYSEILRKRAAGYPVNSAYKKKFGTTYFYYYTSSLMQGHP